MQPTEIKVKDRRSGGFTIIELLVTMAVVAILANVAVPAFYTMQQNMRVSSASNKLHGLIHHARSAASKTQNDIHLCPVDDQWNVGVYTTAGDCSTSPASDRERRTITFDSQVTVNSDWSTDGLIFKADGALISSTAITPVIIGGTSDSVANRRLRVTTTGTSKIERMEAGQ